MIILMWEQWRHVWGLRNLEVHGQDAETRARAERASLSQALREVYDQRHNLEPQVASFLHQNEHDHLSRRRSITRNWLVVNLPIVRRSVRRVRKRSARGMQSIRSYY